MIPTLLDMGLGVYRPILATPGLRSMFAAATVARMPLGFEALAMVLLVREVTGSFTIAGAAAGASFAVGALTSAFMGRLIDRYGQRPVVIPAAIWNAAAASALATAGLLEASGRTLIGLAALTGVLPQISSCQRAILADRFSGATLQAAFAVESIIQEAVFTLGPLIATVVVALASPASALFVAGGFTLVGSLWFTSTRLSREWRAPRVVRSGGGAMQEPAVRLLWLFAAFAAVSFGGFEVAVTAFAREQGSPNLAGLFLALWALGSAVGGLAFGARGRRRSPDRMLPAVALTGALLFLPTAVAPSLWWIAPGAFLAGVAIAPMLSLVYTLVGELAPEGMVTEAFAWLNVAFPAGFALGALLSGTVADGPGARVAVVLTGVGVGISALVTWRRRGTLAPRHAGRSVEEEAGTATTVR